jgi:hypothetical protein
VKLPYSCIQVPEEDPPETQMFKNIWRPIPFSIIPMYDLLVSSTQNNALESKSGDSPTEKMDIGMNWSTPWGRDLTSSVGKQKKK